MDRKLLDILACPVCKGPLVYNKQANELICKGDRLAYPIKDDIPVMLEDEARELAADEAPGPASFRLRFIDALYNLDEITLTNTASVQ